MKKFGKFLFGTLSIAALAGGAYYFVKNVINKDSEDDFDEFEDDFEDFDLEDDELVLEGTDTRGYVPINLSETSDNVDDASEVEENNDDTTEA